MDKAEILKLFERHGALLNGHFRLSSGLHSGKYLQCALVLQHPDVAESLAKAIAAKFSGENIDAVVGPALGGITLAYEVARALKARALFTEREDGRMALRRGFSVRPGEKVLVVEDVVTTGLSTKEVIETIKALGGEVAGVGSVIDRSDAPPAFGVRFEPLARVKIETYKSEECPLCGKGIPVTKPGSRK